MYNKKQLGQIYSLNTKTMIDDTSIAGPKFRFDLWEEQFSVEYNIFEIEILIQIIYFLYNILNIILTRVIELILSKPK